VSAGSFSSFFLSALDVGFNDLSGTIGTEIGKLTNLQILKFQSNQIEGPIPSEIGQLVWLRELYMEFNFFANRIPSEIGNLVKLSTSVRSAPLNRLRVFIEVPHIHFTVLF
jgi:Leucine-rich repeat (LRR) protein